MTLKPRPPVAHRLPAVWTGGGEVPPFMKKAWLAVGNFDGVHLGHQALLERTMQQAKPTGAPVGLMTFEPHPRNFFRPLDPVFQLTPPELKHQLAGRFGCTAYIELPFGPQLAQMTADAFIDELLIGRLDVRGVVVGIDFQFGRSRSGTSAMLAARMAQARRLCIAMPPVRTEDGEIVSSSAVRDALAEGDIARANRLLGYEWFVRAEVTHGDKRGRELGYPTANMLLPASTGLRHGIYAVRLTAPDGVTRAGVASFGRRPTFDNGAARLETHVFDFRGDLYGQVCDVAFVGFIRPEERFEDIPSLIAAMDRDSAVAREMLAAKAG